MIASGQPTGTGVVVEGRYLAQASDIVDAALSKGHGAILDSLGPEIFSAGGAALGGIREQPWFPKRRNPTSPLSSEEQRILCERLAEAAVSGRFTAVVAPARFIQDVQRDDVSRDVDTAIRLRAALDSAGGAALRIFYPLVAPVRLLASDTARLGILSKLREATSASAIDALWIRATGFDITSSGPINLRRYITGVRGFHGLRVPVVGDRAGTLGLAMLALGVVSSISSGITVGERYDPRPLLKPRDGAGFLPAPRVYIPAIGAFMDPGRATALLKHPSTRNWFACQRSCCRNHGMFDTLADPRRHFVVTRSEEVADLARIPEALRPGQYLETWLRPATDRAAKAVRIDAEFEAHRHRIDGWRTTLAAILDEDAHSSAKTTRSVVRMPTRKGA
jgi:hypothetical protein